MIMRDAAIQAALGLAMGFPIALLCVRFVQAQLYEVKGVDAAVLLVSVFTLALAASVAAFIPARRAASIDPARALRIE
jgi:macrolide transport system ATP-binding/permease protein